MALTPQGIVGFWIIIGVAVGIALGASTDRLGVTLPLGIVIGFILGALQTRGRSGTVEATADEEE